MCPASNPTSLFSILVFTFECPVTSNRRNCVHLPFSVHLTQALELWLASENLHMWPWWEKGSMYCEARHLLKSYSLPSSHILHLSAGLTTNLAAISSKENVFVRVCLCHN